MQINEGLKEGDLEELVLPLLSIDEFESKLDDDSIVVAFFVLDREPAADLNRFIQKGAVNLLDTDVSPAPNEDGYYMVFVELLRDQQSAKKIIDTLDSIKGLTALTSWKAQIHDIEGTLAVDLKMLQKNLCTTSVEDHVEEDEVNEELTEFFSASDLRNMVLEGHRLILEGTYGAFEFDFVDLGTFEELKERNAVLPRPVS